MSTTGNGSTRNGATRRQGDGTALGTVPPSPRRRRSVAGPVAAAITAAALIVGGSWMTGAVGRSASAPVAPAAAGATGTDPEATTVEAVVARSATVRLGPTRPVPDAMGFTPEEILRAGDVAMVLTLDLGEYANSPTVSGQACNGSADPALAPAGARQWSWAQENTINLDQFGVDLIVTVWGDAGRALAQVAEDSGYCHLPDPVTVVESDANTWIASAVTTTETVLPYAMAVRRVDDALVAVTVHGPPSTPTREVVTRAQALLMIAAAKADAA